MHLGIWDLQVLLGLPGHQVLLDREVTQDLRVVTEIPETMEFLELKEKKDELGIPAEMEIREVQACPVDRETGEVMGER